MAGTGKSQVIQTLIVFFARQNESHPLIVMAPTGTAAALVGGSTVVAKKSAGLPFYYILVTSNQITSFKLWT
jgi:hypothetical protein